MSLEELRKVIKASQFKQMIQFKRLEFYKKHYCMIQLNSDFFMINPGQMSLLSG